ncbi:MAG TPA: glycerate kinase, partial [Actinomycetota bacterium]|nr:glycerate kinase [Actinomycetota bacterium]
MRILVAPDKFKGTLAGEEVADAIARGWSRRRPRDAIERVPVADGGDGTLEALVSALGGVWRSARVSGPLGDEVEAEYAVAETSGRRVAVVEMARASGLALVADRQDPLGASTRGTGELIREALRERPDVLLVCIGGSATTDGGAGMAQALGVRLVDDRGDDLPPGGAALERLAKIDPSGLEPALAGVEIVVASDVDNPLTGPQGAAAVYGLQKGCGPEEIRRLDAALERFQ